MLNMGGAPFTWVKAPVIIAHGNQILKQFKMLFSKQ